MASTILMFLKLFGPRAVTTSTRPNSWAAISLWRSYFEKEYQEKIDLIEEAVEEHAPESPIESEHARMAREQFAREMRSQNSPHSSSMQQRLSTTTIWNDRHRAHAQQHEQQVLNRPNVLVPVNHPGGNTEFAYLAQ